MKIARTKNTVRNILTGSVSRIINIILPFFNRTVILYVMGTKYLGLSSLFTSILSFLSLSELGLGAAMVYSMYKPIARNDDETICALLNLYKRLYRIIGFVVLGLGMALMPFLRQLINDEIPPEINLHLLYFIYLFNSVLSYWLFAYKNALLQAHQRNDVNNVISAVIIPASYAVMLGALWLTKNYYAYVIWQPVFTIITNLIRSRYVDRHFPHLKPRGEISSELRRSITKKVAALIGTKLNTVVLNAADNLVMSAFLGLTVIAVYGNYYMIMSSIIGFLGIIYSAMTAGLGNSLQTETVEKNYRDFEKLSFMNSWLVGWCSVCLVCLYQPFMRIWVGEELMFPFYVVLELGLYFYIYQLRKIPVVYKDAAGIWWEDRFRPYVCMVTNVVLNILLVQIIGISGIILSTVFSLCISIPWENYTIFKYVFHRSSRAYYGKLAAYCGSMILGGLVCFWLCSLFGDGIPALMARAVICVIVPNVIFAALNCRRAEFRLARDMVLRILRRQF
ncbi:MAG: oligosaccharide flippase family protein [Oscillospiraceae bacterium]|nr:oligosaccharide flippase family protein [Oscillospiraceae bacterium]